MDEGVTGTTFYQGDCLEVLKTLPDNFVDCCVTSPPYWGLRDYGVDGQLGLEKTPEEYTQNMVQVFEQVRRVLKNEGTLWLNLGDSYASNGGAHGGRSDNQRGVGAKKAHDAGAGDQNARRAPSDLKPKDLVGIPWRVAFALQGAGWYLRQDIIWHKPNPMPESVRDRCTKAHEYIFLLSKNDKYYFDIESVKEPVAAETAARYKYGFGKAEKKAAIVETGHWHTGKNGRDNLCGEMKFNNKRNRRSVWTVTTKSFKGAHFATFPPDLIEPCILAGCPFGGVVLDPFFGAGTTGVVAEKHGRNCIGIELNENYLALARGRINKSKEAGK